MRRAASWAVGMVVVGLMFSAGAGPGVGEQRKTPVADAPPPLPSASVGRVVLEMSPKPFSSMEEGAIRKVCTEVFRQWAPLLRHADSVAVLLWTADGSEILEYRGRKEDPIEWARYIGHPNPREIVARDSQKKALHSQGRIYRDAPPVITYADLATIVRTLKQVGREMTGKPVHVGATFDPGGEFARSPFKYEKHNEICLGSTMGRASFVCCYTTLHADPASYAGFPAGIPEGTPLGTFLGRQCQHFLKDLDFDYIWLSNGFGFGMETWKATGPLFDGRTFDPRQAPEMRDKILQFWRLFRAECPKFPIETRGTNLTTGIGLSSNAVPLREIYAGGFDMTPPPNSPWAALNGDFGLEMAGHMSRIAELPKGKGFPFRYYVHDPWWLNSPWLDRYGREPHDIYLPLSIGRIDAEGRVETPQSIALLTIDDSYGRMPEKCPNEVIPHILTALEDLPDRPGPLVWVYPFDEYHDMTFSAKSRLEEPFFADWFIRAAINNGLPLNTVVSSKNFLKSLEKQPRLFRESVLITTAPDAGSPLAAALVRYVHSGGQVLLYGPLDLAGEELLRLLDLRLEEPIAGRLQLDLRANLDLLTEHGYAHEIQHREAMSAGGCREVLADADDRDSQVLAVVSKGKSQRIAAICRRLPQANGGRVAWVRGTNSNAYTGGHLLTPDNPKQWFQGDLLMRFALGSLGYRLSLCKEVPEQRGPITTIARHENGFVFSGYTPNTNVELRLRLPQGAPILVGQETRLVDGQACYRMPRAWHRECRVLVEQTAGEIACIEQHSGEIGIKRRLMLTGMKDATLRFYPELARTRVTMQPEPKFPFIEGPFLPSKVRDDALGHYLEVEHVTGSLLISW